MRARAAEHRAAKRRRRLQYAALALVGIFGVATGWFTVASLPYLAQRIDVQTPPPPEGPRVPAVPSAEPMPIPAPVAMLGDPLAEPMFSGEPQPEQAPVNPTPEPVAQPTTPVPRAQVQERDRPVATSLRTPDREAPAGAPSRGTIQSSTEPPPSTERAVSSPPPPAATTTASARPAAPPIPPVSDPPARIEPETIVPVDTPGATPSPSAVAAPAAPAAPAIDLTRVRADVRGTIERYRSAYESLDAAAAQSVWPGVDAAALSRAFGSIQSQRLSFDDCAIDVAGASAEATCTGRASIVPKIGGGSQTVRRTWRFRLAQNGDSWTIANAIVR